MDGLEEMPDNKTSNNCLTLTISKAPAITIMPPSNPPLHPTMWAISYDQLMNFHEEAAVNFGSAYQDMTMRDVNTQIISPVCRVTGTSYSLYLNPRGLKIDAFVTHAWDEPFGDFVESIRVALKPLASKPNLWICSFALVQGNDETVRKQLGQESTPLAKAPFVRALQEASSYVVVRNTKTDIYSRIWCVAEVIYANKMGLIPGRTFVTGPDNFTHLGTSVLNANATREEDKARILKLLLNEYNYQEIDDIVNMFRMQEAHGPHYPKGSGSKRRENSNPGGDDRQKHGCTHAVSLILALAVLIGAIAAVIASLVRFTSVKNKEPQQDIGDSNPPTGFLRISQSPSHYQPIFSNSFHPTDIPSKQPTHDPSMWPSIPPTYLPTKQPSHIPSISPTLSPSHSPTILPSKPPSPTTNPTNLPTSVPSLNPTESQSPTKGSRLEETKDFLISKGLVDEIQLQTVGMPENLAMTWIADLDDLQLDLNDEFFLQRYVLALFYYSTKETGWIDEEGWLSNSEECNWFGINTDYGGCDSGRTIQSIVLDNNGLKGDLPSALFLVLTDLVTINLDGNCIQGTIPPEITNLNKLETLWMDRNGIGGEVPVGLWYMTSLKSISLYYNNLTGEIPYDSAVCQKQPSDIFVTVDCGLCPDWVSLTNGGTCCDNCWNDWFDDPVC